MTNYKFLQKLQSDGVLDELTRRGMFPLSLGRYKIIVDDFENDLCKHAGQREKTAIATAERQGVTKQTVYSALRLMRQE